MKKILLTTLSALTCLIFLAIPSEAAAAEATFKLDPSITSAAVGGTFWVDITIDTDTAINAVQADLTFSHIKLEVVEVDTATSDFTVQAQAPEIDNNHGTVQIVRGEYTPGVSGTGKLLAKIQFKALTTGTTTITFENTSMILADADNEDIFNLSNSDTGNYTVTASSSGATYLECQSSACIRVSGSGSNQDNCTYVGQTCGTSGGTGSPTHLECRSNTCTQVSGAGSDTGGCTYAGQSCGTVANEVGDTGVLEVTLLTIGLGLSLIVFGVFSPRLDLAHHLKKRIITDFENEALRNTDA
ncbi:cohesin domain-containing protein [Candidatus Parcubacteria bacterium]|nr:cohesin domain-containing protein [Candidatus Parcubacteria bacterium]